jgi:hypothetical protein
VPSERINEAKDIFESNTAEAMVSLATAHMYLDLVYYVTVQDTMQIWYLIELVSWVAGVAVRQVE